jgi:uncharacterized protein YjgD (DUF1641 family)
VAKPILLAPTAPAIPSPRDLREDMERKLDEARAKHAAAILDAYELIQALHDAGSLNLLRGLAGAEDDIIGRISSSLNSPEAIRGIRNFIVLSKIAASIDPKILEAVSGAISDSRTGHGTDKESTKQKAAQKPPSLWTIFKRLRSENSRRALGAATDILDTVGQSLSD